jgi:hypothetical protein
MTTLAVEHQHESHLDATSSWYHWKYDNTKLENPEFSISHFVMRLSVREIKLAILIRNLALNYAGAGLYSTTSSLAGLALFVPELSARADPEDCEVTISFPVEMLDKFLRTILE